MSPLLPLAGRTSLMRSKEQSGSSNSGSEWRVDSGEGEHIVDFNAARSSFTVAGIQSFIRLRASRRHQSLLGWAGFIIAGQVLILGLAWGFLIAVFASGNIALPDATATRIKRSPDLMTFVVTIIATILSLFSGFLFTRAVRLALLRTMERPHSMGMLSSMIDVAKGTFVYNSRRMKWTFATAASAIALSTMTGGWVTLITPTVLNVTQKITGTELDVSSPAFRLLMNQTFDPIDTQGFGGSGTPSGATVGPLMDQAALAAAGRVINSPNILNVNGAAFNVSTGGIIPSGSGNLLGLNTSTNDTGFDFSAGHIPARWKVHGQYPRPAGFQTNHTLTQQGFTANVSCQRLEGDPSATRPSLNYDVRTIPTNNFDLQSWNMTTACRDGSTTYNDQYITLANVSNGGAVAGNFCPFQNMSTMPTSGLDPSTHLVILQGIGDAYSFINASICAITPIITTARVDYSSSANVSEILEYKPLVEDLHLPHGSLGHFVGRTVARRLSATQDIYRNGVGDSIASVYRSTPQAVHGSPFDRNVLLNQILVQYITGTAELSGTILREGFSANGFFANNEIPANMSKNIDGYIVAETMGWSRQSWIAVVGLLPITAIALASIALVIHALMLNKRNHSKADPVVSVDDLGTVESFNPLDPLHLMGVSSFGGLTSTFSGPLGNNLLRSERVKVRMTNIDGRNIGLVADDD